MKKFLEISKQFRDQEDGAAMVEYSILVGIITVGTIALIGLVGAWVTGEWTALEAALNPPAAP